MTDEPSIKLGPLAIWVFGRQFPNATDYWDGNWLTVTARCEGSGSRVEVTGSFLHLGEISQWQDSLEKFYRTLDGFVELPTIEPTLKVKLEGHSPTTGHLKCTVEITGNHMSESHRFLFDSDQSYLLGVVGQLAEVLRQYPIIGKQTG